MSQQPPEDWRAAFRALEAEVSERLARGFSPPELKPIPLAPRPLKGHVDPCCYKGHRYTPETTGWRMMAGNKVRKCLVCEAARAGKPRKPLRHGTTYAYRKGCRCKKCKAAHADSMARWRMKGQA